MLFDSVNPGFILAPSDTNVVKIFLFNKWDNSRDTSWAWKPQNSCDQRWPLEENLAHINRAAMTAGMGGFPLGDLYHWWPEAYQRWKAQEGIENARISTWLETGSDSGTDALRDPPGGSTFSGLRLHQNYPNPFNPATCIPYSNPETGYVCLRVFNLMGREVVTLFEGVSHAGKHEVFFDGSRFAGGIYMLLLKTDNAVQVKKIVLFK